MDNRLARTVVRRPCHESPLSCHSRPPSLPDAAGQCALQRRIRGCPLCSRPRRRRRGLPELHQRGGLAAAGAGQTAGLVRDTSRRGSAWRAAALVRCLSPGYGSRLHGCALRGGNVWRIQVMRERSPVPHQPHRRQRPQRVGSGAGFEGPARVRGGRPFLGADAHAPPAAHRQCRPHRDPIGRSPRGDGLRREYGCRRCGGQEPLRRACAADARGRRAERLFGGFRSGEGRRGPRRRGDI